MNDLILQATPTTPAVHFRASEGTLTIEGESYPENATRFYESLFSWIDGYFNEPEKALEVNFKLNYFNTSSSKCILDMLEVLERHARQGWPIRVVWHYHGDDEDMLQSGEEFAEDVSLDFTFVSH